MPDDVEIRTLVAAAGRGVRVQIIVCKVMIVDELWVSVGSTHFDARSFSVNRISLEEWEQRPWTEKL